MSSLYQISTSVLTRVYPEICTPKKKSYSKLKFSSATGCVLKTELWNQHLGFTSQCELSECLPASKSPHSSLLIVLYQRQTQPSILTRLRAERYYLHLALWLPESTCNRPTGPNGTRLNSIAPPTFANMPGLPWERNAFFLGGGGRGGA